MPAITEEQIFDGLREVVDPELHINVVDLGLVYNIDINEVNEVHVIMTLTTPGCPMGASIAESAEKAVMDIEGVKDVLIEIVFEPPWNLNMLSDLARDQLGV